jgi:hypothetical protein
MVIDAGMTVIGVVGQFVSMAVHVAGCSSMPIVSMAVRGWLIESMLIVSMLIVSMAVRAGGELPIGGE